MESSKNYQAKGDHSTRRYIPQITSNPITNKSNAAGHSGTSGGNGTNVNGQGYVVGTNQMIHIHHHHYTKNTTQNNTNFSNDMN